MLWSLGIKANSYLLKDKMKVWLQEEASTGQEFTQDMSEQCSLIRASMAERARLMSEIQMLPLSEGASKYLDILRVRQETDEKKHRLLRELLRLGRDHTHQMNLAVDDVDNS